MRCPNCKEENTLNWRLTCCEFKCSNCGELFTLSDLKEKNLLPDLKLRENPNGSECALPDISSYLPIIKEPKTGGSYE